MGTNFSGHMASIIDMMGVEVILTRKSNISVDRYGKEIYTGTNETITVGNNDKNSMGDFSTMGEFFPEDKLFFLKASEVKPNTGDIITFDGVEYSIMRILSPNSGSVSHYEVFCEKL